MIHYPVCRLLLEVKVVTEVKVQMVPVARSKEVPERCIYWLASGGRQDMAGEITEGL